MNDFELKTYNKYNKFLTKIRYEFYKIEFISEAYKKYSIKLI